MLKKILVIEDDFDISNLIKTTLENEYAVSQAYSGTEAILLLKLEQFDLILLDLMLPGKSGEEVLHEIRDKLKMSLPIIVLTAMNDKNTTTKLLLSGADDYITKPFDPSELLARMTVQFRKHQTIVNNENTELTLKNMTLLPDTFSCQIADTKIALSLKEYKILTLLLISPKKIFTKEMIYKNVWEDDYYYDENTVNVHISKLRNKLKRADPETEYIETIWGVGVRVKGE